MADPKSEQRNLKKHKIYQAIIGGHSIPRTVHLFLPPANEVCEGNVFTGVGAGACVAKGGMCGKGGACVVKGSMHGEGRGVHGEGGMHGEGGHA